MPKTTKESSIKSSDIQLQVKGKTVKAYLAEPAGGGPGVLVLHAWWGLNPFFKRWCDRLAQEGFCALAPDLRDGQVATTIEAAEELMKNSDRKLLPDIVMAAKDRLLSVPGCKGRKIGVIGFSMGGDWSLFIAAQAPDQVAATVLFYGAGDGDFEKIRSKILGHYSDVDEWESLDWVRKMEGKLKAAGVDVTLHIYPGRPHWFVEDDRPEYDPEAAKLAWDRTMDFLKANL